MAYPTAWPPAPPAVATAQSAKPPAQPQPEPPLTQPTANSRSRAAGKQYRLFEGTWIEAVLTNRLNATFTGPVNCMVTTNVYSHDRQHVLIPQGSRVLGESRRVDQPRQQPAPSAPASPSAPSLASASTTPTRASTNRAWTPTAPTPPKTSVSPARASSTASSTSSHPHHPRGTPRQDLPLGRPSATRLRPPPDAPAICREAHRHAQS
ncbi:MAG: hypothetical protein GC160_16215 [Acidobacteria bacterium]|nr:hypothetical protein [Acidobacteriota bacterium]